MRVEGILSRIKLGITKTWSKLDWRFRACLCILAVISYFYISQLLIVSIDAAGSVSELSGDVWATRDGVREQLNSESVVFKGDIIETSDGGSIEMLFADGTFFSLGGDSRLSIDEFVYDAASSKGSQTISILEGAFSFVSGLMAKDNPSNMVVETPIANIGIRGTKVVGDILPEDGASSITVIEGRILLSNAGGEIELTDQSGTDQFGNEGFATARIVSAVTAPEDAGVLTPEQTVVRYGTIFNGDTNALTDFIAREIPQLVPETEDGMEEEAETILDQPSSIVEDDVIEKSAADFQKGKDAYSRGNYATALEELRSLAEQGDAKSQSNLGLLSYNERGVTQDYKREVDRYTLGGWYRRAAERGFAPGQNNLGLLYDRGEGVTQDKKEAAKWYRRAAKQGYAEAQHNLGVLYHKGEGVPKDYKKAVKWYKLAAEQGDASAQNSLGFLYEKGEGVPQDYKKAAQWYRLSAEQGDAKAQSNLGFLYAKGEGVPKDYKKAVKWYRLAAEQGYASAQFNLGVSYGKGEGVFKDFISALMWVNLAAGNGLEYAVKARNIIEENITQAQIEEAETREKACLKQNYKGC